MGNIFRTATTQAILDIIAEHGSKSRFGQLLTDGDAEAVAARVVDLFEMTLELRARNGLASMAGTASPGAARSEQQTSSRAQSKSQAERFGARGRGGDNETLNQFPTTIHAEEFISVDKKQSKFPEAAAHTDDSIAVGFRLPRTRKSFSAEERQAFLRRK